MKKQRHKPLTFRQHQWLQSLHEGKDPGLNYHGRSEHGGASKVVYSLHRRGFITGNGVTRDSLTDAGRLAIGVAVGAVA